MTFYGIIPSKRLPFTVKKYLRNELSPALLQTLLEFCKEDVNLKCKTLYSLMLSMHPQSRLTGCLFRARTKISGEGRGAEAVEKIFGTTPLSSLEIVGSAVLQER